MNEFDRWFKLYFEVSCWVYATAPWIVAPITLFINAPFGRFSPADSKWMVDGNTSWMLMEIVAPVFFIATYLYAPFSPTHNPPSLNHPSTLLAALFVIHYVNRAIISPLRSPGRSKSHIIIVIAGIGFNIINAPLIAAFLSAPGNFGIALFVLGFVSNILHDEILYNIRRNAPTTPDGKHRYSIPQGYLYNYISYPNYFSEWVEFAGFALAASPRWEYTPPWMFLVAEMLVMAPRAHRGHQWYHTKFPDYPTERRAVIPFVF
ncbi:related to steroid 5alpha-reductase [Serendipita indica DSM 11827]|uniref:Related to steroid 5alpha-reductase n=1 Tax=Serendipita indica (strain DSM 11827) TaxID=1109443 RepID=G4TN63_SERID|nr:related to steroid 5alpha-reductase [Serendipita indica DSM 11827]